MLEFLFEKPTQQWDILSYHSIMQSLSNSETRSNFNLYLQSKPDKRETALIKELMQEQLKLSSDQINPINDKMMRHNFSLVSLLSDNSIAHDS